MARLGLGVGLTRRGGGGAEAPTIASLFAGDRQGAWFDPSTLSTLFQKPADGVEIPVDAAGQSVSRIADRSGRGNNATQATASRRPTYQTGPARLALDKIDDLLLVTVPAGGWTGTMVLATDEGTASYGVTLAEGARNISGGTDARYLPGSAIVGSVFRDGALTSEEKAMVEAVLVDNGAPAGYGAHRNFTNYWNGFSNITEFPTIDVSSGAGFTQAWRGCSGLTSFPELAFTAGAFYGSWNNCSNLATFPANMFNNVTGGQFTQAFNGTNLTEASIDNILVSLVASGIAAGTRVFDQSGGSAPSTKTGDGLKGQDAIDTLRSLGWTVAVTGGY